MGKKSCAFDETLLEHYFFTPLNVEAASTNNIDNFAFDLFQYMIHNLHNNNEINITSLRHL